MYDIKFIRENREVFAADLKRRGIGNIDHDIIDLDQNLRLIKTQLQDKLTARNEIARNIGVKKSQKLDVSDLIAKGEKLKELIPRLQQQISEIEMKLDHMLINLPNALDESVPNGSDEESNLEIKKWGDIREFDFTPLSHDDLGQKLNMMDFETAAKISGSRFVILKNDLARMERALINLMLDMHTQKFGYQEVSPPLLVKDEAMFGVGQLPKFDEDSFLTRESLRLIPTAEVSLTNIVADSIIDEIDLPLRYTAATPCFRSEAGSAGSDAKGMIRQHQFYKVELVSIVHPDESSAELERLTNCAEEILRQLNLPYRVVLKCSGDTGFSSTKTYDIEVWVPSQNQYREISSCSNCSDFQARRMKARFKDHTTKKNHYVHTLNGSALAVGRTMVAIIENYQNNDGSITVPDILVSYMNGTKIIRK